MAFYYAPMEGITLYPLRNIHKDMFGKEMDKYFTPFLTAAKNYHFKKREQRDVLPEYSTSFCDVSNEIVPQLMANQAEIFIWAAKKISALGYNEINLNMGCPAATVVNRHKGSGLLEDPDILDRMLFDIFDTVDKENLGFKVSLKTRLGLMDVSETPRLMEVLASYPASELTIHARVRSDFYKGEPRLDTFCEAVKIYRENGGKADICYNGSISTVSDYNRIKEYLDKELPDVDISYMIGRGLVENPALVREICGGEPLGSKELKEYLDKLYVGYEGYIPEERNVIFKMLEHWAFLHVHFKDCDKQLKAIRKARSKGEYLAAVNNIFSCCEFT